MKKYVKLYEEYHTPPVIEELIEFFTDEDTEWILGSSDKLNRIYTVNFSDLGRYEIFTYDVLKEEDLIEQLLQDNDGYRYDEDFDIQYLADEYFRERGKGSFEIENDIYWIILTDTELMGDIPKHFESAYMDCIYFMHNNLIDFKDENVEEFMDFNNIHAEFIKHSETILKNVLEYMFNYSTSENKLIKMQIKNTFLLSRGLLDVISDFEYDGPATPCMSEDIIKIASIHNIDIGLSDDVKTIASTALKGNHKLR